MKPHKVSSRAKLAPVLYGDPVCVVLSARMRERTVRRFKCEDEGAYYAYVTETRDTQMAAVAAIPRSKNQRATR